MKIKKQWLIVFNGYNTILIKTNEGYFMMETTNITAFVKIEKMMAKDFIKRTKLKTCYNCGSKKCNCKDE